MYPKPASMARSRRVKSWRIRKRSANFSSFFFLTFAALKFASFSRCLRCFSKNRQLWLLLMSICIRWVGMLRCCSPELLPFWKKKQNVFPVAAAVVCFPTCSFASYLLIAIYKDLGDGVSLSSVSSVFHLGLHVVAMGRARHSPSGNTYLFSFCDAIYAHWKWVIPWKLDKWCLSVKQYHAGTNGLPFGFGWAWCR